MIEASDRIITAYAEHASGPGWSNSPVWVIVRKQNGEIKEECIQPVEQTLEMQILFTSSSAISGAMRMAVIHSLAPKESR